MSIADLDEQELIARHDIEDAVQRDAVEVLQVLRRKIDERIRSLGGSVDYTPIVSKDFIEAMADQLIEGVLYRDAWSGWFGTHRLVVGMRSDDKAEMRFEFINRLEG